MKAPEQSKSTAFAAFILQPEIIIGFFLLWFILVGTGTGIAIIATKYTQQVYAEQLATLPEDDRLAEAANVEVGLPTPRGEAEAVPPVTPLAMPSRVVIESLGIDLVVSNPETRDIEALDEELKSAVVRYPDSAILGEENSNVLIFGHSSRLPMVRNQFYKAFNGIEDLTIGEEIRAVAENGAVYTYRVSRVYRASASDDSIAITTQGHKLTLLTCNSFGQRSDRWVVEADFVGISG